MAIIRWQPRNGMAQVHECNPVHDLDLFGEEMARLFGWTVGGRRLAGETVFGTWGPPIDVVEEPDRFRVTADIPGMKKDDIHLTLDGDTLTIHGEKKQECEAKNEGYSRRERYEGSFSRSFELPGEVDPQKIEASYKNGVLEISIAKSDSARPKQIPIQS